MRPSVWSIPVPFAVGVPDCTLSYAIDGGSDGVAVIDPGWSDAAAFAALETGLRRMGRTIDDVSLVLVTHLHLDHLSGATILRERTGASVAMHRAEVGHIRAWAAERAADSQDVAGWGLPEALLPAVDAAWGAGRAAPVPDPQTFAADIELHDGDVLAFGAARLRVLHTPGHTDGHVCLIDDQHGLLFSGDHVLPRIKPGVGLGGRTTTNPLEDAIRSLERVANLPGADDLEVCPGHEYRFRGLAERARSLIGHRAERTRYVADALDRLDRPSLFEVASAVPFRGGVASMSGFLLASAVAQTGFHVAALGRTGELAVGAQLA